VYEEIVLLGGDSHCAENYDEVVVTTH